MRRMARGPHPTASNLTRSGEQGVRSESGDDLRREFRSSILLSPLHCLAVFFCAFCAFSRLKFRRPNARAIAQDMHATKRHFEALWHMDSEFDGK